MNNYWRSFLSGLMLLIPGKMQGAEPVMHSTAIIQSVLQNQSIFDSVNYSQKEIDAKLSRLYKNVKGTRKDVKYVKSLLNELSKYDVGKSIIMNAPEDIQINAISIDNAMKYDINGVFVREENAIYVIGQPPKEFYSDTYTNSLIGTIGHELDHSIQYHKGLCQNLSSYPSKRHVEVKLCELETLLLDTILESEIKKGKGSKSDKCIFYEAEIDRYKKMGMTDQEAKREARTNVAKLYWTGDRHLPEGHSRISTLLWNDVAEWNATYDIQTLGINTIKKEAIQPFSVFSIYTAEEQEKKEAKDEAKLHLDAKYKTNSDIISTYMKRMNLNLPENYFAQTQREMATTGDFFVINEYPNGQKKDAFIVLPNGDVCMKKFSQDRICLSETLFDKHHRAKREVLYYPSGRIKSERAKNVYREYHESNSKIKCIYPYDENGNLNGYKKEFDENERPVLFTPLVNGVRNGIAYKWDKNRNIFTCTYDNGSHNEWQSVSKEKVTLLEDAINNNAVLTPVEQFKNHPKKGALDWLRFGKKEQGK